MVIRVCYQTFILYFQRINNIVNNVSYECVYHYHIVNIINYLSLLY